MIRRNVQRCSAMLHRGIDLKGRYSRGIGFLCSRVGRPQVRC
jgi:hypothetical protein